MAEKHEAELLEDFSRIIKLYSDGSVVRGDDSSFFSHSPDNDKYESLDFKYKHVEYKDVVLDEEVGLWVRLYLPPETTSKTPVVMYYHCGGFILFTPATPFIHHKCQMWAATLGVLIVLVNYRMASEHRLPCAYDDSVAALHWLQLQALAAEGAEPWLHSHAEGAEIYIWI
ncbi:hypothetical protein SUGI_0987110 [Cryptomeria japonica]|uniref:tuliposide A-converting enzyme b1, amyloplastic-like n=1 Tax=Cryptomeria japonica TaxID=3369 RepID=UPI002414B332|nr:tuliposide A-converting enzyme b1, amyloplastic-like [Cryptomeria japonica]GLJ46809.1 hypothetical protein SUGI_0987110 [Cryptomeria japonica]